MDILRAVLYNAIIVIALIGGFLTVRSTRSSVSRPYLTIAVATLLSICLFIQLGVPGYLPASQRMGDELVTGQWWRLVTALFAQDGGLKGGAFNIAFLLALGTVAEPILGRWRWSLFYGVTGVLAQFAGLLLQPEGAGNSVANLGLAAGILVYGLRRGKGVAMRILLLAAVLDAAVLLLLRRDDIHGAAFLIGCGVAGLSLVHQPIAKELPRVS